MTIQDVIKTARGYLPKNVEVTRYSGSEIDFLDSRVQGFSNKRNLARIKINNNENVLVQIYSGEWYKPSLYVQVKDVDEALKQIKQEFSTRGKDIQGQ